MSFFEELKRRNVFRVGIAYVLLGWVVLQAADFALDIIDAPNWIIQALLIVGLAGLPITLFFAWAFEITPEGIKREADVDRSASIAPQTSRKLDRAIITFLTLAVVLLLADRFLNEKPVEKPADSKPGTVSVPVEKVSDPLSANPASAPDPLPEAQSIAVLPFVNMSSDAEQDYFSDGISEEILNVLARIPDWKVAARTSSFQFKDQNLDIADIARHLNVTHVLEGSVRKAGNRVRIAAQLIEADTGYHLWSDTYDRELQDVFAIQDEISAAIAGELQTRLTPTELTAATPVAMTAYELYLKGRGLVATRSEPSLLQSIEVLNQAIEAAPDYAPAMATLARAYAVLPWFSDDIATGEARELARQWAQRALELDPDNDEALAALAVVYRESDLDLPAARDLLVRALTINRNSVAANNFLGDDYARSGNLAAALEYESRAAELDPLGAVHLSDLGQVYLLMGDLDMAIDYASRSLELSPGFQNGLDVLMDSYYQRGDLEGLRQVEKTARDSQNMARSRLLGLQHMLALAEGDKERAEALWSELVALEARGEISAAVPAFTAALRGDFDLSGQYLLKAHATGDGTWTFPIYVRLPEQAPDSEPWQTFWALPGPARLAEYRRSNSFPSDYPGFDSEGQ